MPIEKRIWSLADENFPNKLSPNYRNLLSKLGLFEGNRIAVSYPGNYLGLPIIFLVQDGNKHIFIVAKNLDTDVGVVVQVVQRKVTSCSFFGSESARELSQHEVSEHSAEFEELRCEVARALIHLNISDLQYPVRGVADWLRDSSWLPEQEMTSNA